MLRTTLLKVTLPASTSWNHLATSSVLNGMPPKRKLRVDDPIARRVKEDKRAKKLMKALKKLDKKPRIPRVISENEVTNTLRKEIDLRQRQVRKMLWQNQNFQFVFYLGDNIGRSRG